MVSIVGRFVDSGGVPIPEGALDIRLDAPLYDRATTPDSLFTQIPATFPITNGAIGAVSVVESESQNITYQFTVSVTETNYEFYFPDGKFYSGPTHLHTDGKYYTGAIHRAESLELDRIERKVKREIDSFHAIVPNVATVEYRELIPTRVSTDRLPYTVRQVVELLLGEPVYLSALNPFRFEGEYDPTVFYSLGTIVSYAGSGWFYKSPTPTAGNAPAIGSVFWQPNGLKGSPGGTGGQDTPYDATGWNGATWAPTANVLRDIIETLARSAQLAAYAPLASPALTGTPTAPTQTTGDRTSKLATTQFLGSELALLGQVPVGAIVSWITGSAPAKWLICDGRIISRTTYAALFAVIGTAFGAGNGTTTFAIPDMRGRVAVGVDNPGTPAGDASRLAPAWANTIGGVGGAEDSGARTSDFEATGFGLANPAGGFQNRALVSVSTLTIIPTIQPSIALNWIIYAGA